MLGELYKYFTVKFRKRLTLYTAILFSSIILATPLLQNVAIKLVSLIFLIGSCGIFVSIFVSQFASNVKILFQHRNRVKLPVSKEIADLAKRIGVQVKELGIVKGRTAYVIGKTVVLGTELLKRLTYEQRQAVVAHELGHIKKKHSRWSIFSLLLVGAISIYCFSNFYVPTFFIESEIYPFLLFVMNMTSVVFAIMAFIPISWHFEKQADAVAAEFAGKEHIKSALREITPEKEFTEPSESHPSTQERIKNIDKLDLPE
jgi:STE24 endopeptidase